MDKKDKLFAIEQVLKTIIASSNKNTIKLGKNLRAIRDRGTWQDLNYDTFNQWLSSLGIMPRSATRYITIVEKYIDELKVEEERLYNITPARLEKMIPFANSENIDEWLTRAETCSNKDFIDLVNEEMGKSPAGDTGGVSGSIPPPCTIDEAHRSKLRLSPKEYLKRVKKGPCCVCGGTSNIQGHHFPQTRRRTDADWKQIPLCPNCHAIEQHQPTDFWLNYKRKIGDWFYNLIVEE